MILDAADLAAAAQAIAAGECMLTGQVCSSLTQLRSPRVGTTSSSKSCRRRSPPRSSATPFDAATEMRTLAAERQRGRVEGYIARGKEEGATLATGGGRRSHLDKGWFVEPTVFGNVDNGATIAREEIFGPVLTVIPPTTRPTPSPPSMASTPRSSPKTSTEPAP